MKDFIHKTLINAGGKDAVSNMLTGAAMGAGANTALGAVQGDFDIIGNATSGALLGAGGGAALRHAGDKYTSGIAALAKAGNKDVPTNTFNTNIFTHAIKEEADFMGNPEMMKRAQGMAGTTPSRGATTNAPTGGSVNTGSRKDGGVNRPGAEGHRDQPIAPTHVEIPSMPSFDRMGMPMSSGTAKIPVVPNTDNVGETIGRAGHKQGGGFTPMNAKQATAAQMEKDVLDANKANRADLKSTFTRNKIRDQAVDRRQQRVIDNQVASDIRAVDGDLSRMGGMPYSPDEIARGFKKTGKDVNQWAQESVAKKAAKQNEIDAIRASRAERQQGIGGNFDSNKESAMNKLAAKKDNMAFEAEMSQNYVKHSDGSWGFPENAPQPKTVASKKSKKKGKK